MNNFFIIGNGDSGTSLLRGLINAHSQIYCEFESWRHKSAAVKIGHLEKTKIPNKQMLQLRFWEKEATHFNESKKKIWGNKVPLEQFITHGWKDDQILKLGENFKIIWIVRRYSQYSKSKYACSTYKENWKRSNDLYWKFRERYVDGTIMVSFEDLILRTTVELKRICRFLNVRYEKIMLTGTADTGYDKYNYGRILTEKI